MEAHSIGRRWQLKPAPVYAGPLYCKAVLVLFLVNAVLFVAFGGLR